MTTRAGPGEPAGAHNPAAEPSNHQNSSSSTSSVMSPSFTPRSPHRSRHSRESPPWTPPSPSIEQTLPADDGMGAVRQRILRVQSSDATFEQKSSRVHEIMMEPYRAHERANGISSSPKGSVKAPNRPFTPIMTAVPSLPLSPESMISEPCTTATDREPTYHSQEEDRHVLGCLHYQRNVKLQCSACGKWYTCRFCHDAVEDHALNRRATRNMLCMLCGTAQSAAAVCHHCQEYAAWYYCDVCKLWDNDSDKNIYHCDDCGICRRGKGIGKDFFHCKTCCACLAIGIRETHRCIERSTDCDCPICGEYLFTSPQTVVFMPCGHSIHYGCYKEHVRSSFKCPLCSRSLMNMDMTFRQLDQAIASQPMPAHFRSTRAWVYCNDCSAKSQVAYHWLGLKCAVCDSYNTVQLQLQNAEESSHRTLDVLSRTRAASLRQGARRTASASQAERPRLEAGAWPPPDPPPPPDSGTSHGRPEEIEEDDGDDDPDFWGGQATQDSPWWPAVTADEDSDQGSVADSSDGVHSDSLLDDDEADEPDQMELIGHP